MSTLSDIAVDSPAPAQELVTPERDRGRAFLILLAIVLAGVALRMAAIKVWGTGAIESEGAEYARIAENLRNGAGYVGIVTPGPELMFPPLFPLLIAGFSFLTGSYVTAGRLVSFILGVLLPLPAYGIASRLFSRRVGLVAALLVMLHPLLVNLSFTVLTEGPYATLLLSAVYLALLALERPSTRMWCLVGGAFGVCYLLRQEAVAPLLIAVFFLLVATKGKAPIPWKQAVAAIAVFLALAAPEIIYIYHTTGKLRLEAKTAITTPLAVRILNKEESLGGSHGTTDSRYEEAVKWGSSAINDKLERIGVWLIPEVQVAQEKTAFKDIVRVVVHAVRQNTPLLIQNLSSRWLGAPFLPALALLGVVRQPWRQPKALGRSYLMLVPLTAIAASCGVLWIFPRYYFVLVPFLLIWAANGLVAIAEWGKASAANIHSSWLNPVASEYIIPSVIGLVLVVYPIGGVRSLFEFLEGSPASRAEIDVGAWIKQQHDGTVTIMDRSTPLAFHAGAQFVYFPYCSGELALRFLDAAKVDYVILRRDESFSSYYVDWFERGIPNPRAQLVYVSSGSNAGQIVVFRWRRRDGN